MVTHNEALAQACDRIIRIEDGNCTGPAKSRQPKQPQHPQGRTVTVYEKRTETCPCLYEIL